VDDFFCDDGCNPLKSHQRATIHRAYANFLVYVTSDLQLEEVGIPSKRIGG
jgi:hypothetical protein